MGLRGGAGRKLRAADASRLGVQICELPGMPTASSGVTACVARLVWRATPERRPAVPAAYRPVPRPATTWTACALGPPRGRLCRSVTCGRPARRREQIRCSGGGRTRIERRRQITRRSDERKHESARQHGDSGAARAVRAKRERMPDRWRLRLARRRGLAGRRADLVEAEARQLRCNRRKRRNHAHRQRGDSDPAVQAALHTPKVEAKDSNGGLVE